MPQFSEHAPPTLHQLRAAWRTYHRNGVIERVILEIQHLRGFFRATDALREVIEREWYDEAGVQLVALNCLRAELREERSRAGVMTAPDRPLPPFVPPTRHDVAELERRYATDGTVLTLIAELRHARAFVLRVAGLHAVTQRCWRAETDCDLAALVELGRRIDVEKTRAGIVPGAEPARREASGLTARIALDFDGQSEMNRV